MDGQDAQLRLRHLDRQAEQQRMDAQTPWTLAANQQRQWHQDARRKQEEDRQAWLARQRPQPWQPAPQIRLALPQVFNHSLPSGLGANTHPAQNSVSSENTGGQGTVPETPPAKPPAVQPDTQLTRFDSVFAAQQLLGKPPVTPHGRVITPHAAERMVKPPSGRSPMTMEEIDEVLDRGTRIRKVSFHPKGDTVTIQHPGLPGKPQVVVDAKTGKRVITVIKNN